LLRVANKNAGIFYVIRKRQVDLPFPVIFMHRPAQRKYATNVAHGSGDE